MLRTYELRLPPAISIMLTDSKMLTKHYMCTVYIYVRHERLCLHYASIDQPTYYAQSNARILYVSLSIANIITSVSSIKVKKKYVDRFDTDKTSWIPHSHFKAKFSGDLSSLCDLECVVDVVGAREPNNKFNIDITPKGSYITAEFVVHSIGYV